MHETFHHYMLVRQEHLNQYGSLFGGRVLAVIDELAFIACTLTWPGNNFVTRVVEDAEFTAPARQGDLLRFDFGIETIGRTSVSVHVVLNVYDQHAGEQTESFNGRVIMVCVDGEGNPIPVPEK